MQREKAQTAHREGTAVMCGREAFVNLFNLAESDFTSGITCNKRLRWNSAQNRGVANILEVNITRQTCEPPLPQLGGEDLLIFTAHLFQSPPAYRIVPVICDTVTDKKTTPLPFFNGTNTRLLSRTYAAV